MKGQQVKKEKVRDKCNQFIMKCLKQTNIKWHESYLYYIRSQDQKYESSISLSFLFELTHNRIEHIFNYNLIEFIYLYNLSIKLNHIPSLKRQEDEHQHSSPNTIKSLYNIQMYSAKRSNDRRVDITANFNLNDAQPLNIDKTLVLISQNKPTKDKRKLILKIIQLPNNSQQFVGSQDAILRKTFSSSLYYFKPECYDFIGDSIYLCFKVQSLSLQSLLWIHRMQKIQITRQFLRQFIVKMYEGLARLKTTDVFPNNLKPTNLFLECKDEDKDWVWSEAGLHTNRRSQFYTKVNLLTIAKNNSIKIQFLEMQFYSLGVIILEMITLQPVQKLDKILRKHDDLYSLESYQEGERYYGRDVTTIIKYLLNPPKDSSLNKIMQQYKEGDKRDHQKGSKQRREFEEEPDYSPYCLTQQRIQTYVEDKLIERVQTDAKRYLKQNNCSCREVFDKINILDPQFTFSLTGMSEFRSLLDQFNIKLSPDQLLFICTYYTSNSNIRYFKLIQRLFEPKQLIQNIIAKAVQNYDSFKDFFESQTDSKQFWKSQEVKIFLQKLQVPFEDKEINQVVKGWTGSTRTSVKYDQLYKVFKPILGMSLSLSTIKKPHKSEVVQGHGSALQRLIELLLAKQSDLIGFFRKHDLKQNWILDFKIQKILRSYIKADDELFKHAFTQMWEKGSIPGDMSKQINYIYLIRNLELYQPIELFRMILTQKINEAGRENFFEKYRKEQKGWTIHSFIDFNRDQNLDFEQRQLKALFAELDTDRSGIIEQRELVYKLTGLKQFDYTMIVQTISSAISKKGVHLFKDFKHYDTRARLVIGNLNQLKNILQRLDLELSQDHVDQLFNKFARNGKFQYLVFLREFYSVKELFVWAVQFILEQHYKGDFQKLFPIGLREGRKKWNRQSLVLINEDLVLGFREVELGEIWTKLDPNQEGSLTKEQVAIIFNFQVEKREELTRKPVESIRDLPKRKGENEQDVKTLKGSIGAKQKQANRQKAVIHEIRELGDKKLLGLPIRLLQQSEQGNGRIELQACLNVFQKIGVQSKRADLLTVVSRFKELQGSKKASLNFVLLVFYLFDEMFKQSDNRQKETSRYKAQVCVLLIKQIKKNRGLNNEEIFSWCRRKDRMRLSDFQQIFRKIMEVDVYFEDLQEIWQSWGEQDSFSLKEFDNLLKTHEFKQNKGNDNQMEKHKTGDKYEKDKQGKGDKYDKGKYDREDSRGEKHDREDKYDRGDKYGKTEKYDKTEKDDRGDKYERGDKHDRGSKYDRNDKDEKLKRGRSDRQAQKERDSDREDRLDSRKKGFKRLTQQNKMRDFVHNSDVDTPNLNKAISFGEPQSSRKTSIKDSDNDHNDPHEKGTSKRTIKQTAKFGGDPKSRKIDSQRQPAKKSSFQKSSRQQKIDLEQQHVDPKKQKSRHSKLKQDPSPKRSLNKTNLLQKFKNETEQIGNGYINELFSKTNLVQSKKFINCLCIHYNFQEQEATQFAETLATFGKIKLQSLRKQLSKQLNKQKQKTSKSKQRQGKRQQNDKPVSPQKKSPNKKNQQKQKNLGKKLVDPRRQKINVPLVRQHIRLLLNSFGKRFQMAELETFFFDDHDSVSREDFIRKCQSVDSSFKQTICQRIFDYLKPDGQDRVGLLSFKLGTGMEDTDNHQSDDFLPEQLQKQLRLIFQKADKDHSGTIQANELQGLMSSLGFNQNIKQIQNYFSRIDQNYDNKISYNEFRRFIEDQILPQLSNFDEQQEELQEILRNNDIFRHGSLSAQTLQAVLQRYGVKLSSYDIQILVRSLNPEGEQIRIKQLLMALRQPTLYPSKMKSILYKIRLRKKVQLKQIQKIFENISSCFVLAFTPSQMERQILNISTPFKPQLHESGLFYHDLSVKDVRKIGQEQGNIAGEILPSDMLVEILMKEISGVPIPQKTEIKGNIKRRYMNVSIFDLSSESMKNTVWQVEAEWDPEVQDIWTFSNTHKSLFVKIGGYQPRKYEKYVLLFELVIDAVESGKTLEINCGCATLPLRQLLIPQGKTPKKLKLIAGLPNRAKQIDKTAVSKRGGWKTFFGGEIVSEFQLELIHQAKFKDYHKMLATLPNQCIVARRAVNYLWIYRQLLAQYAFDGGNVNTFLQTDVRVMTFALTLDSPEVFLRVWPWWKQKVEPKVKNFSQSKKVLKTLLQQLYLILNAKQYELLKKCPVKPILHNTSLLTNRNKMITDVLQNIENWLNIGITTSYKRKKNYNFNYGPLRLHEIGMPREHRIFMQTLARLSMK